MTAALVWLADAAGLLLAAAIAYLLTSYFAMQIKAGRRVKLALGVVGKARRTVSVAESTAGLRLTLNDFLAAAGRFLPLSGDDRRKITVSLQRAGFRTSNALGVMLGVKLTVLAGGFLLGFVTVAVNVSGMLGLLGGLLAGLLGGVVLNVFPELIVSRLGERRTWRVNAGLPDTFDLLVICLESGLTFDRALQRTVENLGLLHPDLEAEFNQVLLDLRVHGRTRGEALGRLAERLDSHHFRDLAMTVDQSERHGTPLADALRRLGSSIRVESIARVQEKMARLPTLLVVPSIAGILPGILLIVGGPAFLKLGENIATVGG